MKQQVLSRRSCLNSHVFQGTVILNSIPIQMTPKHVSPIHISSLNPRLMSNDTCFFFFFYFNVMSNKLSNKYKNKLASTSTPLSSNLILPSFSPFFLPCPTQSHHGLLSFTLYITFIIKTQQCYLPKISIVHLLLITSTTNILV